MLKPRVPPRQNLLASHLAPVESRARTPIRPCALGSWELPCCLGLCGPVLCSWSFHAPVTLLAPVSPWSSRQPPIPAGSALGSGPGWTSPPLSPAAPTSHPCQPSRRLLSSLPLGPELPEACASQCHLMTPGSCPVQCPPPTDATVPCLHREPISAWPSVSHAQVSVPACNTCSAFCHRPSMIHGLFLRK